MAENGLLFIVSDKHGNRPNTIYLVNDNWDDWFTYSTVYNAEYLSEEGIRVWIGKVKIADGDQKDRRAHLPERFEKLEENYYSLGATLDYYVNLKDNLGELRDIIMCALNDIAYDLDRFHRVKRYDVVKVSLCRDITPSMIEGQLHRIAHGGALLTEYAFDYFFPSVRGDKNGKISFVVSPESKPSTNIHAIIGKNGIGKTTLLRNMLEAVDLDAYSSRSGGFEFFGERNFSNIVFVSYSVFDDPIMEDEINGDENEVPYVYIGIIGKRDGKKYVKNPIHLCEEFSRSLVDISLSSKAILWRRIIELLESDNTFSELHIGEWISLPGGYAEKNSRAKEKALGEFRKVIERRFYGLSSGHKVILLTLTKLVELVEEKTIVLLDEPEGHLHPPLVSAFIRALSYLLVYRNGVGIISTHSPVIVQEIPQKCVWMLRRVDDELIAERPRIQTFGENLGELTEEIFGYEVFNSGFHKMIQEESLRTTNFDKAVSEFDGELGKEAKSLLKALIYERLHRDD